MIDILEKLVKYRKFKNIPVEDEKIYLILAFANKAPSMGNLQPWHFLVVKDSKIKEKLAIAALHQNFISLAPVVIVIAVDLTRSSLKYGIRGERVYSLQDAAHVALLIKIACGYLNLGSYLVRAFDEDEVKRILNLPDNFRPIYIIPIGYPDESGEFEEITPFENITSLNTFENKIKIDEKILKRIKEILTIKIEKREEGLEEKF